MADGFSIDASDLMKLAADLGEVPKGAGGFVHKAVEVSARHVKDSWRDRLKGSQHVPAGAASITYDIKGGQGIRSDSLEAEIGPELGRRQAAIVGILEVGTPTTGPRGFGIAALRDNTDDFERGLSKALDDALGEVGL